jgi:Tol biopolymer transport system component
MSRRNLPNSLADVRRVLFALVSVAVLIPASVAAATTVGDAPSGRVAVVGDGGLYVIGAHSGVRREAAVFVQSAPAWSPAGRALAYVGDGALRVAALGSGRDRVLLRTRGRFSAGPDWSPGGSRLAFALEGATDDVAELVVVGSDGRHVRVLDRQAVAHQVPQWSPDGRTLAYLKHSDAGAALWVARWDGSRRRLLRRDALDCPESLSWSPDGKSIAFIGRAGATGNGAAVVVTDADGSHARVVAAASAASEEGLLGNVSWSPRGRIAFIRWAADPDEGDSLYVAGSEGGAERLLVRAPYIDEAAWSPDGRWLAYLTEDPASASGLPFSVWIVRADGSGKRLLARLNEHSNGLTWGWSPRLRVRKVAATA